jgi:mutator protein MutT
MDSDASKPSYHRVVAAVLCEAGQVLLCHRRQDLRWYPDVWDLPGGHVDDGETAAAALARELDEELGIHVPPPDWPPVLEAELAEDTHITVWAFGEWDGNVTNCAPEEHDELGWFGAAELQALDLADPAIAELCLGVLSDG